MLDPQSGWGYAASSAVGDIVRNNHAEANKSISYIVWKAAFYTFEKTRAVSGEDAGAVIDVFNTFKSREYLDSPAKPLRLCKEKLNEYHNSPVVESLREFRDHVEAMHKLSYSFEGTDEDVARESFKELSAKAVNIVEKAHEATLGKEEFKILFDDPNFQDVKKQWEESRAAWAGRQYHGPLSNRGAFHQAEKIHGLLEPLNEALKQYADTVKADKTKTAAVQKMHGRVDDEGIGLLMEKAILQKDEKEVARLTQFISGMKIAQEARSNAFIESAAQREEEALIQKEVDARRVEDGRKAESIMRIIKDSMGDLKKELGSGLTNEKEGLLSRYMQEKMLDLSSKALKDNQDVIKEGLTSAMKNNVSVSILGNVHINTDGLKSAKIDIIENIKNTPPPSIETAEAVVQASDAANKVGSDIRAKLETKKAQQSGYISTVSNTHGKGQHVRS